ncbi:MAG: TetR/AcrR family transcriptional regulator [Ruthenibacterium lactatiformans]
MIVNIPMVCMKGAGAMARNKYPEETVARILDVSLKLFLEKGYENTTIQDIIDALGNLSKEPFITISSLRRTFWRQCATRGCLPG